MTAAPQSFQQMTNLPLSGKDFYDMSGPDLLAYCGADASKWAEAFCKIKEVQGWDASDIDEGLMICWFANAIEHSSHIRTLSQSPATDAAVLREDLEYHARFLLDRLQEFDPGDFESERDFHGHVAPAIARLRNALGVA